MVFYPKKSQSINNKPPFTTTKKGHIAIQISSQTTKKSDSENPRFRTRIRRKFLSLCETVMFAPVQSQPLRNSETKPIATHFRLYCLLYTTCDSQYMENNWKQTQTRNDLANWLTYLLVFDSTSTGNVLRWSPCRYTFAIHLKSETFWSKLINATT
jgi:hypothetical protein